MTHDTQSLSVGAFASAPGIGLAWPGDIAAHGREPGTRMGLVRRWVRLQHSGEGKSEETSVLRAASSGRLRHCHAGIDAVACRGRCPRTDRAGDPWLVVPDRWPHRKPRLRDHGDSQLAVPDTGTLFLTRLHPRGSGGTSATKAWTGHPVRSAQPQRRAGHRGLDRRLGWPGMSRSANTWPSHRPGRIASTPSAVRWLGPGRGAARGPQPRCFS